jgi:hypothetical protein
LRYINKLVTLALALAIAGCATQGPIEGATTRYALQPQKDQVLMQANAHEAVGGVLPIDVALANGSTEAYSVHVSQIYGVNAQGQRVVAVPIAEAEDMAGDAGKLKAGLKSGAAGAGIGAVIGAAGGTLLGLAAGALLHSPGLGAAWGATSGAGLGALYGGQVGAFNGVANAERRNQVEIMSLSLYDQVLQPDFTANGYVYLPAANQQYTSLEVRVTNGTGESMLLSAPLAAGAAQ